jgi:hypothetical protein
VLNVVPLDEMTVLLSTVTAEAAAPAGSTTPKTIQTIETRLVTSPAREKPPDISNPHVENLNICITLYKNIYYI